MLVAGVCTHTRPTANRKGKVEDADDESGVIGGGAGRKRCSGVCSASTLPQHCNWEDVGVVVKVVRWWLRHMCGCAQSTERVVVSARQLLFLFNATWQRVERLRQ